MAKPKGATSYRLSETAQYLLARMADRLGLTKTGVLEMAIRKLADVELEQDQGEPYLPSAVSDQEKASVQQQAR